MKRYQMDQVACVGFYEWRESYLNRHYRHLMAVNISGSAWPNFYLLPRRPLRTKQLANSHLWFRYKSSESSKRLYTRWRSSLHLSMQTTQVYPSTVSAQATVYRSQQHTQRQHTNKRIQGHLSITYPFTTMTPSNWAWLKMAPRLKAALITTRRSKTAALMATELSTNQCFV